jgi:MSHA biogenesis protein MshJ
MKQLLDYWVVFANRLDGRAPRERVLIMLLSLALVWGLFDALWLGEHEKRLQAIRAINAAQAGQVTDLTQRIQTYQNILRTKSDHALQMRKEQLQSDVASHQLRLSAQARQMVSPAVVLPLLSKILPKSSALELTSLRNLKPEPLGSIAGTSSANAPETTTPVLWRHKVEVRMRGSYPDIVNYLVQLEQLQASLGWHQILLTTDVQTENAPARHTVAATLVISTLSMEAQWLEF